MEQYIITNDGEKILPGSRRPDGTLRKERRIRAGYTPQDEQPVYQSVGALVRTDCRGQAYQVAALQALLPDMLLA